MPDQNEPAQIKPTTRRFTAIPNFAAPTSTSRMAAFTAMSMVLAYLERTPDSENDDSDDPQVSERKSRSGFNEHELSVEAMVCGIPCVSPCSPIVYLTTYL